MVGPVRNAFFKGHGLGNDYIVLDPEELDYKLTPGRVRSLCDRHEGIGGDGVLALVPSAKAHFGLRVFNPDGSEAEKSGNGLRIFARYLHATKRTRRRRLTVETRGGVVTLEPALDEHGDVHHVTVSMGRASFHPEDLPCTLEAEELLEQPVRAGSRTLRFTGVSVGNPHCVVFRTPDRPWSERDLRAIGPALETHRIFPARSRWTSCWTSRCAWARARSASPASRWATRTASCSATPIAAGTSVSCARSGPRSRPITCSRASPTSSWRCRPERASSRC